MGAKIVEYQTIIKKRWTKREIDFLKNNYIVYGPKFCADHLQKSVQSVHIKAHRINIGIRGWSDKDIEFLRNNFGLFGPSKCAQILGKKKATVQSTARRLGLKTDVLCGRPRKEVIAVINDKRAMMICKYHGCVEFYIKPSGVGECLICIRKWTNARRRTKLGNYGSRLRSSLNGAFKRHLQIKGIKKREGCFRYLSYSPQELCDYLEIIKKRQNNQCPMCRDNYKNVGFDIDHIIPISSTNNEKELLRLFDLNNLSLLCPRCNRHIKRDRMDITYGQ